MTPPIRAVSYGGGVQSTALMVLAAQRVIDFPVFLHADVGHDSEAKGTIRYVRQITDPLPTVAACGNHHGLLMWNNNDRGGMGHMVTPVTEPARSLTTTGHQSLLMPYYSQGVAQPVDRPVPTVPTRDRFALVDDCGFRMLEPHEVAAAMAFPDGYIPANLAKKDRVKLAGNAVTPPVMTSIAQRIVAALEHAS